MRRATVVELKAQELAPSRLTLFRAAERSK
jgi:hypothetical protein